MIVVMVMNKKIILSVVFTMLLGIATAKVVYSKTISSDDKKSNNTVYFLQLGVYTNKNSMQLDTKSIENKIVTQENDKYYNSIANAEYGDERKIKTAIDEIVNTIKKNKSPITLDDLDEKFDYEHPSQIEALAKTSKLLASLNGLWGLAKWPSVNPKNIRDKIFVILEAQKEPMHFSEIAEHIRDGEFSRRDVTTQAIHNELIKDKRFVLIGRGIYALDSWGFKQGTVSDIIASVLKDAGEPLYRDEIVKRVLEKRKVKETTVLLNLQSKPEFKRVAKATYTLADLVKED
jgi:predicted Zn-ribbon and HTH transcriptional regulator